MNELEQAVHEEFSRDALAVYADALITAGDVRGELIALELAPAATPAWHERRRAVMAQWVGKRLVGPALQRTRLGFLDTDGDADGLELLASPAGAFVRRFAARGGRLAVNNALRKLIGERRPWLIDLTIAVPGERDAVDPSLAAALLYRTRELRTLTLDGRALLELPHPRVERAVITGFDALKGTLPNATHVDLALHASTADPVWHPPRVASIDFPRLRVLDLSRNERGRLGGDSNIIDTLAASRIAQLDELILPSLTVGQARQLAELTLPCTRLARSYHALPAIAGVDAPAPFPWPSPAEWMPRDGLAVAMPAWADHHDLLLAPAIEALEAGWSTMSAAARAAWSELFDRVAELPVDDAIDFAPATLACALDGIAIDDPDWRFLAQVLQRRPEELAISRRRL